MHDADAMMTSMTEPILGNCPNGTYASSYTCSLSLHELQEYTSESIRLRPIAAQSLEQVLTCRRE